MKGLRSNKIILFILFIQFFSLTNCNSSMASITSPKTSIETINLGLSRNITITNRLTYFTEQKMFYQRINGNQDIFTVFTVRNAGHDLKKITITVAIDSYEWEQVFCQRKDLLDVNYDFSLTNDLVVSLKDLDILPEISSINISFSLEYYLSVTKISASFQLVNAKIVQINEIPPSDVFIIPDTFSMRLLASESLLYRNHFVLDTYILTNMPPQHTLYVTLRLDTSLQIESISLLGATMTSDLDEIRNFNKVKMILNKNQTGIGLQLKMVEVPEIIEEEITLEVDSASLSLDADHYGEGFFREIDIPEHPIPGELMFIVLILVLFGVPSYMVYKHQENEAKKRLNILRGK